VPGGQVIRAGSHALVWTLILVPTIMELARGWRPVRDDAMVSIGAYRVFSSHSPTLGVWSQGSQGLRHAFFDLGPLMFWLLAVPVRIDPNQGAKWGAAIVCGAALSLAVEALWATKGWPASLVFALVVADVGWQTQLFTDLVWNPHFGLVFMMAAVALGWAVAAGRFGWWPVLVFVASVSAQCHLLYVIPSVSIAVLAPFIAWVCGHRPTRWRWLTVGLLVIAVSWITPVAQQLFGHPGNVTLILDSGAGHTRAGVGFGLHALATAGWPRPIWITQYPYLAAFASMPHYLEGHGVAWAFVALALLVAVAVIAWMTHRRQLAALSVIGVVTALGTVVGFATFPTDDLGVTGYLGNVLWVVGPLIWIVAFWALGEVVVANAPSDTRSASLLPGATALLVAQALGVCLLVVVGFEALRIQVPAARSLSANVQADRSVNDAISRAVKDHVARGPVIVEVTPSNFGPAHGYYAIDEWGVAFNLLSSGWQPFLNTSFFGPATHLTVPPGSHFPTVVVKMDPATRTVISVRRRR
jgi:hypothetical protein